MPLSRKNHYLPQMYLDGWAQNGVIYVYDLLVENENIPMWSKPKQISSIAYMDNLYVGILSAKEFDDIEHYFDKYFETPAKKPLEKIRNRQKLTSEEWHIISDFVAAQYVRVPAFCHHTHNMMIDCVENALHNLPPIEKRTQRKQNTKNSIINEAEKEFIPLSLELTEEKTSDGDAILKIETSVGKGIWLYSIKHFLNEKSLVRAHFNSIKWSICEVAEGIKWPSSDNPFVIINKKSRNPGLIDKDNIFIFPISSTLVLVGKNVNRWPWMLKLSPETSYDIREAIILNAERYIYFPSPDAEIPKTRPRIVNREEYLRIKQMYDNWHDEYIKKEGPMLNANQQIRGWPQERRKV